MIHSIQTTYEYDHYVVKQLGQCLKDPSLAGDEYYGPAGTVEPAIDHWRRESKVAFGLLSEEEAFEEINCLEYVPYDDDDFHY